jgi:DNA-directed RNA polymerase specialized sigma subunit
MKQAKPVHYINNATFLEELKKYFAHRDACLAAGKEKPQVPNTIGMVFIQIATRLATRFNFNGYTYKEEMVGDGILNAIAVIDNFDPEKSSNPFAYFTQVIYWAFLRRIGKEKKERETRDAMMFEDEENFDQQEHDNFHVDKSDLYILYNQD